MNKYNTFINKNLTIITKGLDIKKKQKLKPTFYFWLPIANLLISNLNTRITKREIFEELVENGFYKDRLTTSTFDDLIQYNPAINRYRKIMKEVRALLQLKGITANRDSLKYDILTNVNILSDFEDKYEEITDFIDAEDSNINNCLVVSRVVLPSIIPDEEEVIKEDVIEETSTDPEHTFPGGYTLATDVKLKYKYIEIYKVSSDNYRKTYDMYHELLE